MSTSGLSNLRKYGSKVRGFSVYRKLFNYNFSRLEAKKKIGVMDVEFLTQSIVFAMGVGKRRIAYVHFPELLVHLETAKPMFKWFWQAYYTPFRHHLRHKVNEVDLLLCNSRFTRGKIKEKWGRDAKVLYPPVDVKMFKPSAKRDLVVTVGRFTPLKNYEALLEVARLLPDVDFEIIGIIEDDKYYEEIANSKPNNVTLHTNLTREEVASHLGRAKVYLHTMANEHFGISIVEAMASGCIPVVHNSGGAIEAIGSSGYTYNTLKECVYNIVTALKTDIDVSKVIERAKLFSSERFEEEIRALVSRILQG